MARMAAMHPGGGGPTITGLDEKFLPRGIVLELLKLKRRVMNAWRVTASMRPTGDE